MPRQKRRGSVDHYGNRRGSVCDAAMKALDTTLRQDTNIGHGVGTNELTERRRLRGSITCQNLSQLPQQ